MHTWLSLIFLLSFIAAANAGDPQPQAPLSRALFTSAVQQAEPVDTLSEFTGDAVQIFFFTEIRDMAGEAVMHTWEHNGSVVASMRFHVEEPAARLWSSRLLTPNMQGTWRVVVTDASGAILAEKTLDYNLADVPF